VSDIHISADIPAGASPEEKTEIRAGAYREGLILASGSSDMRLRMILGEAYQKYLELARWIADEFIKDDPKAPGLLMLAGQMAARPGSIGAGLPEHVPETVITTQEWLLHEAVEILKERLL